MMLARSESVRPQEKGRVPSTARYAPAHPKSSFLKGGRSLVGARLPTTKINVATLQSASHPDEDAQKRDEMQGVTVTSRASADISHVWKRVRMPASPINMLDTAKPNKITLLGKDLVIFATSQDAASQSWEVVEDRCPHRFAPLSQGRIVDGQLMCSYHGWRFGKSGECTDIPQLPPGPSKEAACKQKKACASAYPCTVTDGLLFVWMDNSPEGLLASLQSAPFKSDAPSKFDWVMAQNPNDYTYWLEQGLDPSHANFLHHGMGGFEMKNAREMQSRAVPEVSLEGGFTWRHEGYEARNQGLKAARQFIPPFVIETRYNKQATKASSTQAFTSLVVPVRPGVTRNIFRFATVPNLPPNEASSQGQQGKSPVQQQDGTSQPATLTSAPKESKGKEQMGLAARLFSILPHWLFTSLELNDQDVIVMHEQEKRIRKAGLKPNDYALLASGADGGVAAINRWIRMAGPPGPEWLHASAESTGEVPLERLLDRRPRHVDICPTCQKGFKQVTSLTQVVTAFTAAACTSAVALLTVMLHTAILSGEWAMAVKQSGGPAVVAAVLGAALAVVAAKLWDFREDRFISGLKRWKKKGGLSLVQTP